MREANQHKTCFTYPKISSHTQQLLNGDLFDLQYHSIHQFFVITTVPWLIINKSYSLPERVLLVCWRYVQRVHMVVHYFIYMLKMDQNLNFIRNLVIDYPTVILSINYCFEIASENNIQLILKTVSKSNITMSSQGTPKIRVLVRKRPLSKKQQLRNQTDIIQIQNNQTVVVSQQKLKVDLTPFIDEYRFNFDGAYDQKADNQQIYLTQVRPLVGCAFDGAKVSCFAYGQTGSGKTYTMLGDGGKVRGLYLLAAFDIFEIVKQHRDLSVWVSFYEIYCGKLYDLLNQKNQLFAREDAKNNVNIVGLSQRKITSVQNLMQVIQFGTGIRVTSQNGTNLDSSRSHAILQISIKQGNKAKGKISFIDLAGSERAADHADQLQKQTRIDGAQINKSLLALKQCIRALDQNKNHTPFRGSKLTMVLKDSFVGFCRSVMIGNISPNSSSSENTLNTLKYADRVKQLKKPSKDQYLMQLDNLDRLSKELMLPRQMVQNYKHMPTLFQSSQNEIENNFYTNNKNIQIGVKPAKITSQHERKNQRKLSKVIGSQKSHQVKNIQNNRSLNPNQVERGNSSNKKISLIHKNNNYFNQKNDYNFNHSYGEDNKVRKQAIQHSPPIKRQLNLQNYQRSSQKGPVNLFQDFPNQLNARSSEKYYNLPPQQSQPQDFENLSQQHQQYISLILQQQQQLMKAHENHIYTTIQSVKQQMLLMNEADKIGSNIEDYIGNLEHVLNLQERSIREMKMRISKLKGYLNKSKKIEEKYVLESKKFYNQEDSILANQQGLFS